MKLGDPTLCPKETRSPDWPINMVRHGSIHFKSTDFFLPVLRLFFSFIALSLGTPPVQDIPGLGDDGYGTKTLSKFPGMVTVTLSLPPFSFLSLVISFFLVIL